MNSSPITLRHGAGLLLLTMLSACSPSPPNVAPVAAVPASTNAGAVDTPPPVYPIALGCKGIGGVTVLSVAIGVEGKPTKIMLVQSSGAEVLDKAATDAVQKWRFNPATRLGKAVEQTIKVPVEFTVPTQRPQECFAFD